MNGYKSHKERNDSPKAINRDNHGIRGFLLTIFFSILVLLSLSIWLAPVLFRIHNGFSVILTSHESRVFEDVLSLNHNGMKIGYLSYLFLYLLLKTLVHELGLSFSVIFSVFVFGIFFVFSSIRVIKFLKIKENHKWMFFLALLGSLTFSSSLSFLFTTVNISAIPVSLFLFSLMLIVNRKSKIYALGMSLLFIVSLFDFTSLILSLAAVFIILTVYKRNFTSSLIVCGVMIGVFMVIHMLFGMSAMPEFHSPYSMIKQIIFEFGKINGIGIFALIIAIISFFYSWGLNNFWKVVVSLFVLSFILSLYFSDAIFYLAVFTALLDANMLFFFMSEKGILNKIVLTLLIFGLFFSYYNYFKIVGTGAYVNDNYVSLNENLRSASISNINNDYAHNLNGNMIYNSVLLSGFKIKNNSWSSYKRNTIMRINCCNTYQM